MKIYAYGSGATEPAQVLSSGGGTTSRSVQQSVEDTTSFASGTTSVQTLTDAALDTTSRAARVAALREQVQSGQYTADPAKIATALSTANV